jgi:uncharacterized RDD family membrane protein YckC
MTHERRPTTCPAQGPIAERRPRKVTPQLLVLLLLAVTVDRDEPSAGGVRDRLSHLAGSMSNRVLEELDPDAVVQRLDVDALMARVDIDTLLDRVDVNALLDRVDVNALLDRVDVNPLLDRVDVNPLLDRVDVDRLLDRADVDRLLDRVDADRLLDRIELDRLVARLDLDAIMDRVDVERLLERVDLEALMRRAGIPELVAESTGQVAGSALDLARRELVGLDIAISRLLQRALHRDPKALPAAPPKLAADGRARVEAPAPTRSRAKARFEVSGYYAGPLSRLAAFAGDLAVASSLFAAGVAALCWLLSTLFGLELATGDRSGLAWALALGAWQFTYWWVSTALTGRTPVMALVGLRIVARDGSPLRPRSAMIRTLALPLSLLVFGLGGAWMVVDRERRALHDLLAGSTVVYDWGGRPAEMPTPLSRWIETHGGDR